MKPIVITTANYHPDINRYLNSFNQHIKNAELRIISFLPHIISAKYITTKINIGYPGHVKKFGYFGEMEDDRWYVYTDMFDVIFQKDIPDLTEFNSEILVAKEGMIWEENEFYRPLFLQNSEFQKIKFQEVYCSGTYAMKGKYLKDLVRFMLEHNTRYRLRFNQPLFNLWLSSQSFDDSPMFGTLFANLDNGSIRKIDNKFYWESGKLVPIIHGNGSYSKYL